VSGLGVAGWWSRRSLRARVTVLATVTLALGLGVGTTLFGVIFAHGQIAALDEQIRAETATVSGLVNSNQLPSILPIPSGSAVMAQVVDSAGTVLASSPGAPRILPILSPTQISSWPTDRAAGLDGGLIGAQLRVAIQPATWKGHPTTVIVAAPSGEITQTIGSLRRVLILGVPLIVLAGALATWLAVGSALRPVDALSATADRIGRQTSGGGPQRLPVPPTTDEIARLARTLNSMLSRLDEASARQRTFTADAAHELRSPLASMITQLEVALRRPDQAEWPQIGRDVLVDAARLLALAEDLLLLARTETGTTGSFGPVDLCELARAFASDPATPIAGAPETPLVHVKATGSVLVSGDAEALGRVVRNLLDNAIRYARSEVLVTVVQTTDGGALLTVEDDGPGIADEDVARVFDRFTRLDHARARAHGGSGLGLDIARSISWAHGGDLDAARSTLGGALFSLRLPRLQTATG
jgi:signal transduction histidine kinase